ncbi:MAG: LVIVD repeat-containing protein, partial [Methanobacteriota archaeon]
MKARLFASLGILLVSGCVGSSDEVTPSDATSVDLSAAVRAVVGDVPCEATVDEGTSENLAEVLSVPLDSAGYASAAELWIQGDRAYVARYGTGGFSIVDLSDPLNATEVAVYDPEPAIRGLDVKATTDGSAVLIGSDDGIRIVDVRDAAAPLLEHHYAFDDAQAHMLTVFRVGAHDYVAAPKGEGQDMPIFRIDGGPGAHRLTPVASPALTTTSRAAGVWNPEDLARTHDAFFFADPILGVPTLWVANVWEGIVALDVSEPESPTEILRIPNSGPQYTHTVQTVVLEGGRRVSASVSEAGVNTLRVFDTTDLARPVLLAEWSVPVAADPQHNV